MYRHHHRSIIEQIDSNCDNSIDWDEFSSYMLLENEVATVLRENELLTMYEEPSSLRGDDTSEPNSHKDVVSRMLHLSHGDRILTAGRDGCIKVWGGKDQAHVKTIKVSNSWVTDICYMPRLQKLASCSFNRTIKLYDLVTNEVVASSNDLQNAPMSICSWTTSSDSSISNAAPVSTFSQQDDSGTFIATGDTSGCINFYMVSEPDENDNNPQLNNLNMLNVDSVVTAHVGPTRHVPGSSQDVMDKFILKEQRSDSVHTDWVNKVMYINDLSAVASCSLDKTLCINDVERNYSRKLAAHTKCVYSFDWSPSYKFLASCGMDRQVILWNPITRRPLHTLSGHTSAVQDVLILEERHQILSMSVDKTIKVWDIRNHRCIQTVTDRTAFRPENKIGALAKDNLRKTILTATLKPRAWTQRKKELRGSGHSNSVVAALYNAPFKQVVSGDADGAVCVWDVLTGRLLFRYADAHAGTKMTAMTFDSSMRRLITGAHDGSIKMWNFSNGATIKTLVDDGVSGSAKAKAVPTSAPATSALASASAATAGQSTSVEAAARRASSSGGTGINSPTKQGRRTSTASSAPAAVSSSGDGDCGDEITELLFTQSATGTRHLIGVGWSREVIFWEDTPETKRCLPTRRLSGHSEDILTVAQCPPNVLATGAYDGMIIIWNLESGAVKFRLIPDEYKPRVTMAPSAVGHGGGGGDLLAGLKQMGPAVSDMRAIEVIKFLNTKQYALLATGADGILRLWNTVDGRLLWSEHGGHPANESIVSIGLESTDETFVTGDTSGVVIVNKLILTSNERSVTRLQRVRFQAHDGDITSIFLVEDRGHIVSGGLDHKVKLWDYHGVCVGEFGLASWRLDDMSTWSAQTCTTNIDLPGEDDEEEEGERGEDTELQKRSGCADSLGAGAAADASLKACSSSANASIAESLSKDESIGALRSMSSIRSGGSAAAIASRYGPGVPNGTADVNPTSTRSAAMQAYQQHREERHERRISSDFAKRIYLPRSSSSAGLNFPTTPGRASTSVAHVLHIEDLTDVTRPHTHHATSRPSGRSSFGLGGGGGAHGGHRRLSTSGGPRPGARSNLPYAGAGARHQQAQRPLTVPTGRRGASELNGEDAFGWSARQNMLKSRGGPGMGPL